MKQYCNVFNSTPSREYFINICERAIVPQDKWDDRDSEASQKGVGRAWQLLKCGCEFTIVTKEIQKDHHSNRETWVLHFKVHNFMWFENCHEEDEKHPGYTMDSSGEFLSMYLPTEEVLELAAERGLADWYSIEAIRF
jgi:hypothetical protein